MILLSFILLVPFISALILGAIYLYDPLKNREKLYATIGITAPAISATIALVIEMKLLMLEPSTIFTYTLFNWIDIGAFSIDVEFMADRLTAVMLFFITVIGTLIHIYASGYMRGDSGYGKFFSYFNLFMGSMLLLVLANNPIIMFVGWELVGLSSYLLISFYHKEYANVTAGNKAFIINRIGDFGFIMGLAILFVSLEGSGYAFGDIEANIGSIDSSTLTLIAGLLFIGAMGKSAQIPLFVWLPDAMAGPTPVSALIHAATMVTAGVYMVARFSFLYNYTPQVGEMIAVVGALTALLSAIIASFQQDIKKILAYSTVSQLGYMFIAVGLGAYSSGVFHVFTHAFFKGLLFMGAGAVIIALHHQQNIFKMGNLKSELKIVYIPMLIATLAISGIPPFAGFFSKDAILMSAFASGHQTIWIMATLTALLTSYYMFRLLFVVFHSPHNGTRELKPLSSSMTMPLVVLAIGSATAGLFGVPEAYGGSNLFSSFISLPDRVWEIEHSMEYMLAGVNIAMGLLGMLVAYWLFVAREIKEPVHINIWRLILTNKFYIDEIYSFLFIKPLLLLSRGLKQIDNKIIDGVINLSIYIYRRGGYLFASLQNGKVRYYALYILIGVSAISTSMLIILGGL
jgi:NADH-quinone oxidoreductase subunit L